MAERAGDHSATSCSTSERIGLGAFACMVESSLRPASTAVSIVEPVGIRCDTIDICAPN